MSPYVHKLTFCCAYVCACIQSLPIVSLRGIRVLVKHDSHIYCIILNQIFFIYVHYCVIISDSGSINRLLHTKFSSCRICHMKSLFHICMGANMLQNNLQSNHTTPYISISLYSIPTYWLLGMLY